MIEIEVWMQFFFEDGSVSQGKRISASFLEDKFASLIDQKAKDMLKDLGRDSGVLMIWGAGNIVTQQYATFSLVESKTWASEPLQASDPEHN
jgi:hypothetical protein